MSTTRALYETTCSTCGQRNSVAYIPGNDPSDGPLGKLVIQPVCATCLNDYLELLNLTEGVG